MLAGACGFEETATNVPQTIFSPGWPGTFAANQTCVWTLLASINERIIITFLNFSVAECCDKVEVCIMRFARDAKTI